MPGLYELSEMHFIRPWCLLLIIPCCLLYLYLWRQKKQASGWQGTINPKLLDHLIDAPTTRNSKLPWLLLASLTAIAVIALAGPTWEKLPQPVHQKVDALLIVLDLSRSMDAEDIKPSRLVRARHKVLDILKDRDEGMTGLIAYSADAHIVSPLTDDTATIANLTPALAPTMMPLYGSNPRAAMTLAMRLFSNAGLNQGHVLLITDGIRQSDLEAIDSQLLRNGFELSIIGVGTPQGAPIPTAQGFLKDANGSIAVPRLERSSMEQLAKRNNGRYMDISLDDKDINFLLPEPTAELSANTLLAEREFDQWHDRGPLLLILLLPFAALAFRRGWLLLLPLALIVQPQTSYAFGWDELWQRADQKAATILAEGDPALAAETFKDPQWQATAHYRSGDFETAAQRYSSRDDATAHFNRGNALAKAGNLEDAIAAYKQALEQQPDMEDARFNKELLERLQQSQQQQNDSQQSDNQDQDQDQQNSQQQNSEQQNSEQQNAQQDNSEQQDSELQGSEQQNSEKENSQQQDSDQQNAEQQDSQQEQQQAAEQADEQSAEDAEQQAQQQTAAQAEQDQQTEQQKQAMEQWLRKIPDDPSGLLRRKFDYEHRQRQLQGESAGEQPQW